MNTVNPTVLNIAGRSSNELYTVSVPSNLLNFCNFDFTYFMEESSRLCRECMKTGEYPLDEISTVKNAIISCHKYYENNMRGIFDKIVVDSWIEYICRQGEIGTSTLWNTFAGCKNSFQRAVFQRLSEFRSHHAINQWVNLLKMQEYAKKKLDFVFGCKLDNVNDAMGRLNLFDLMFSVAANEQGYSLDAIGSVKVFKGGRLPNAPFVFGGAAKEVIRNLFKEVHFAESLPYAGRFEGPMSDWEAMDSFAVIKNHLPEYSDNVANTIMKSMARLAETVYMPSGFKAMIDLEIDTLVNSGAFLQKCKRCKEYYIRDDYYASEYCDTVHRDGSTCREIMENSPVKTVSLTQEQLNFIKDTSDEIYKQMTARVGNGITQRDFSEWLGNFNVIRNKVLGGEADFSIFDDFVRYTREYALPEAKEEEEVQGELTEDNRVVKPYQFTKMDRKELVQQGLLKKQREYPEESPAAAADTVEAPPPPPVAKIIRGAHPTSYHEIPVGQEERHEAAAEPQTFKEEVFAAAETAGEAARAAIQSLGAEQAAKEKAEKQEDGKVHLPELEDFAKHEPEIAKQSQELTRKQPPEQSPIQRERKAPQVRLPDFGLQQEVKLPDLGRQEEVKLPDRGKQEETRLPDFGKRDEIRLFDRERKNEAGTPDFIVDDMDEAEDDDTDFVNLVERLEIAAAEQKKPAEMNRAARVVSAYKTVNGMNEQNTTKEEEAAAKVHDDFAKILDNIERNDGFDEEDLPLDPDGIPLSHKTKHVMDAIMKNTRVSPSLVYGRRQAAEQNVVIDEAYRKSDDE